MSSLRAARVQESGHSRGRASPRSVGEPIFSSFGPAYWQFRESPDAPRVWAAIGAALAALWPFFTLAFLAALYAG